MNIRNLFEQKILLKFFSLAFGLLFWATWGGNQPTTITYPVPVCAYGNQADKLADFPDTLSITLAGSRNELYQIDFSKLAWHIDTEGLAQGPNHIEPTTQALFLPSTIKVLHWSPAPLVISMLDPIIGQAEQQEKLT